MGCGASNDTGGGGGAPGARPGRSQDPSSTTPLSGVPKKYSMGRVLGEGGYGSVKMCKCNGESYAMKFLHKESDNIELQGQYQLWRDEVNILERVAGPSILQVFDSFHTKDDFVIVTGLLPGGDLFDRIEQNYMANPPKNFNEQQASVLARKMIESVAFCHSKDVVHRDLKPENLVFGNQEESSLTLIDFGAALVAGDDEEVEGGIYSVPYYAPEARWPEEKKRTGRIWKAADMWSCGTVIYLLVTGSPPFYAMKKGSSGFDELDEEAVHKQIKKGKVRWPSDVKCSDEVMDLVSKLIQVDSSKRLTAAQALKHPWLASPESNSTESLPDSVMQKLVGFKKANNLQAAMGKVMLARLADGERRQIFETFKKYDTDNDGIMDSKEISQMLDVLGMNSPAQQEKVMGMMDDDGSGTVTKEEFAAAVLAARMTSATEAEMKATFNSFDENGDGTLQEAEIAKMMNHLSPDKIKQLFTEADSDGDGAVTFQEWVAAMKR